MQFSHSALAAWNLMTQISRFSFEGFPSICFTWRCRNSALPFSFVRQKGTIMIRLESTLSALYGGFFCNYFIIYAKGSAFATRAMFARAADEGTGLGSLPSC